MKTDRQLSFAVAMMLGFSVQSAMADSLKAMKTATNLGSVLAAEDACGLTYDQEAISAFIEKHVDADDMDFPSTLKLMTEGSKFQLTEMSKSELTAYCTQVKRLAKTYGFTR
jgi:hypothetical protein